MKTKKMAAGGVSAVMAGRPAMMPAQAAPQSAGAGMANARIQAAPIVAPKPVSAPVVDPGTTGGNMYGMKKGGVARRGYGKARGGKK